MVINTFRYSIFKLREKTLCDLHYNVDSDFDDRLKKLYYNNKHISSVVFFKNICSIKKDKWVSGLLECYEGNDASCKRIASYVYDAVENIMKERTDNNKESVIVPIKPFFKSEREVFSKLLNFVASLCNEKCKLSDYIEWFIASKYEEFYDYDYRFDEKLYVEEGKSIILLSLFETNFNSMNKVLEKFHKHCESCDVKSVTIFSFVGYDSFLNMYENKIEDMIKMFTPFEENSPKKFIVDFIPLYSKHNSWENGWALDYHSLYSVREYDGRFKTYRSLIGELLYRLKYHGKATYISYIADIIQKFLKTRIMYNNMESLLYIPPSRERKLQPVLEIAKKIKLSTELRMYHLLGKENIGEVKNAYGFDEKYRILSNAFYLKWQPRYSFGDTIMFDDILDTGATMTAATEFLQKAIDGLLNNVYVITVTKTRTSDMYEKGNEKGS